MHLSSGSWCRGFVHSGRREVLDQTSMFHTKIDLFSCHIPCVSTYFSALPKKAVWSKVGMKSKALSSLSEDDLLIASPNQGLKSELTIWRKLYDWAADLLTRLKKNGRTLPPAKDFVGGIKNSTRSKNWDAYRAFLRQGSSLLGLQKEAKRVVTPRLMLSKATELLNHGLRERAKAGTEMLMAGIDAHNRMLENKPITIERAGTSYSYLLDKGLVCKRQIFN